MKVIFSDERPSHRPSLFILFIGMIMIAIGTAFFISVSGQFRYKKVTASVSRLELYQEEHAGSFTHEEASYTTYVKYTVDGKEYEEELGILSNVMVGERMTLRYDPENPAQIMTDTSIVLPVVIIAGGGVMLIISLISFLRTRKSKKEKK